MPDELPSASSQSPSLPAPRRILVRGVNWIGDAVMTTPALARLRERFAGAHIALLTVEKLAELWLNHPSIDEVIAFPAGESAWSAARRIRRASPFDLALILPNSPRSALEAWLGRIPQRVGYARPWRDWFLTRAVPPRAGRVVMRKRSVREVRRLQHASPIPITSPSEAHQIHEYLHLAAVLGTNPAALPPGLEVTAQEMAQAEQAFLGELPWKSENSVPGPPSILGLHPGAEYGPAKRWPAERFAAAVREVSRRLGGCVWLAFGRADDWGLCAEIAGAAGGRVVNLAGRTSLRELMALLTHCRVLLTNDSGPMHVAAALGTPVVVPFGSTAPDLTAPGLPGDPKHRLLRSDAGCAPCFRRTCPLDFRCMTGHEVGRVVEAVMQVCSAHT